MIRGLMTDEEWAIFMPILTTASSRGGRPLRIPVILNGQSVRS